MDISSTVNKFLNPVEKHAGIIGAGLGAWTYRTSLTESITRAISGNVHAPNVQNMITEAIANSNVKTAATIGIAGYFAKEATNNSTITKLANAAQKGATNFLVVYGVALGLYYMTHANEGCEKTGFVKPPENSSSPGLGSRGYN